MAEKALHMQQQIRQNAQELGDFLSDLNKWENDIKQKDEELKKSAKIEEIVHPVRGGKKKLSKKEPKKKNVQFEQKTKNLEDATKKSRISSYDYDAWSKFDVDAACKDVEEKAEPVGSSDTEDEDEEDVEAELEAEEMRKRQQAEFEKERGNFLFKEGKFEAAVNRYTTAADLDPYNSIIFANRAMALIKLERYAAAEADCTKALSLDPDYAKAVARRATARTKLKKWKEAKEDQEHLLKLQPNNKQAKLDIEKLEKELAKLESKDVKGPSSRKARRSLRRIVIEEIGSDEEEEKVSPTKQSGEKLPQKELITHIVPETPADERLKAESKSEAKSTKLESLTKMEDPVRRKMTVPKSPVQFETEFKKMKRDHEEFERYFEIIPPSSYRSLFHHSIDEVLPMALDCIHKNYLGNKDYWEHLSSLAEVPRFEMALMFLSNQSKTVIAELFNKVEVTDQVSKEQIIKLAKKYGVVVDKS